MAELFYNLLLQGKSQLWMFLKSQNNFSGVKTIDHEQKNHHLIKEGFETKVVSTRSGLFSIFFIKNASLLLRKKIESALDNEIYIQSRCHNLKSHLMSAEVGVYACGTAEQQTKRSTTLDYVWKSAEDDNIPPVAGCVQIFIDKSEPSLNAGRLTCYPPHILLLNFSEQIRRFQIHFDSTVGA